MVSAVIIPFSSMAMFLLDERAISNLNQDWVVMRSKRVLEGRLLPPSLCILVSLLLKEGVLWAIILMSTMLSVQ